MMIRRAYKFRFYPNQEQRIQLNPKYYAKYQKKLAKLQKRLAKKQKGSSNRDKARLKVARLHAKIADCRKDFLNKLTIRLIRENQVVITESLAVKNIVKYL